MYDVCLIDDRALEGHVFCNSAFILEKASLQHVPRALGVFLLSEPKLPTFKNLF